MGANVTGAVVGNCRDMSLRAAYMGLSGPHDMVKELPLQLLLDSRWVWLAHAKARDGLMKE